MQEINQTLTEPAFFKGFVHAPNPEIKRTKYPAIMIVPGGSYTHIPEHQAEDLALAFFARGFQAFYLRYHFIGEKTPLLPSPVYDLGQALTNIRDHAAEWTAGLSPLVVAGLLRGGQVVRLHETVRSEKSLPRASGML